MAVYNEEKRIGKVLRSVFEQNYPKNKMEVIVIDDNSSDKTVQIAKKFPVKIIISKARDAEASVLKGLKAAKGEFYTFIAADMEYCTKNWLRSMVKPLVKNQDIVQVATRYYRHLRGSVINQYLSLDSLQRDPVYQFFSPSLESTIVEKKEGYFITQYTKDKIPPQNAGMFRCAVMRKIYKNKERWMDLDQLCILVEKGYTKFAYVPQAGFYHFHADNFKHLLAKRHRNLTRIYLPQVEQRKYTWFSLETPKGWIKVAYWILLANLFFPLFLRSIYRAFKHRTWLYLLEAPVAMILTDFILFHFLANPQGRKLILNKIHG